MTRAVRVCVCGHDAREHEPSLDEEYGARGPCEIDTCECERFEEVQYGA
jgi:hypothetical protein